MENLGPCTQRLVPLCFNTVDGSVNDRLISQSPDDRTQISKMYGGLGGLNQYFQTSQTCRLQ